MNLRLFIIAFVIFSPIHCFKIYGYRFELPTQKIADSSRSYVNWVQEKVKSAVNGVSSYYSSPEPPHQVCYVGYGCFSTAPPFSSRITPQSPDVVGTVFYFSSRSKQNELIDPRKDGGLFVPDTYNKSLPTVFVVHGYLHNSQYLYWHKFRKVLLQNYESNIFMVDFGKSSKNLYPQVSTNIRVVAVEMMNLVHKISNSHYIDPSNIWCIGHSLGAQTCSFFGKLVAGVGRITGLDPASPNFELDDCKTRLCSSDAQFVDVHHTDVWVLGFGTKRSVGHVDFYYNNKEDDQPHCKGSGYHIDEEDFFVTGEGTLRTMARKLEVTITCSHMMSIRYFTEAVENKSCIMWGKSQNYDNMTGCSMNTCSPVGLTTINFPLRGKLFVHTTQQAGPPFCVKEIDNEEKMLKNFDEAEEIAPPVSSAVGETQKSNESLSYWQKFKLWIKPD